MGFAGCGNPPLCPPARARTCAVVGGYMRGAGERGSAGAATLRATLRAEGCARRLARTLVSPFLAEPIQNGFCGMRKSAPQPAGSCAPLRIGRWVYEREGHQPLWGGCRGTAPAPLHGGLRRPLAVPFHTSPLSRGALRFAGVPTIAASTTPAPRLPWHLAWAARHLGRLRSGVREYPVCAEGWAMWVLGGSPDLYQSHRGYLPVGEASWLNLPVGPPLGALRRWLRGAQAPRSRQPTALWGIQGGKADVTRGKTGARRTSRAATRAPRPPTQ